MKRSVENLLLEEIRQLKKRVAELEETVAAKDRKIAELERQLSKAKKDSSTSSKPPSSDIVKPTKDKKSKGGKKRKRGGQPGHPKHERTPFGSDEIDKIIWHVLNECPSCGGVLRQLDDDPDTLQQVELKEKPLEVSEHRGVCYCCDSCEEKHYAPIPAEVKMGGLVGPRLTSVVAYLKGGCHASFSTIRKYVRDVLGLTISRGHLRNLVNKVSRALNDAYSALENLLRSQSTLNIDETGHKENGQRFWTWCFRAEAFVFFKISGSRGSDVLFELLGEDFSGTIGCDYFSAYRKYMKDSLVLVQFCLAHLIRDLRYLTKQKASTTVEYGQRLLDGMRELFGLFHNPHLADFPEELAQALTAKSKEIIALATQDVPTTNEAQNMAERFRKHGEAYFRFITTPGIEPTNNLAEQAIRFVVIDRVVTQGTRSESGREWCERIWTVIATCELQGRSAFDFVVEAVKANFAGQPSPSLHPRPT